MTKYFLLLSFFAVMCAAGVFEQMADVTLLSIAMATYTAFRMKKKYNRIQRRKPYSHQPETQNSLEGMTLQDSIILDVKPVFC